MDNFIYFGFSDDVKCLFETLLSAEIAVTCMGIVNWFLCTNFTWAQGGSEISVHLCQGAFAQNLVKWYCQHEVIFNPYTTPYQLGLSINSIKSASIDKMLPPAFSHWRQHYQSMVGILNWLATNT